MNLHHRCLLLIILVLIGVACTKDNLEGVSEDTSTFILAARSFYENAHSGTNTGGDETRSIEAEELRPQWEQATVFKTSKYDFVEVPLLSTLQGIALYNFNQSVLTETDKNLVLDATFQRLLVYRDKAGTFQRVIISYIPDPEYLKKHDSKTASSVSLGNMSNFSGYLEYRNLSGKIVQVIHYGDGKMAKRYLPGQVKSSSKKTGITTQALIYITTCVDFYNWSNIEPPYGWVYVYTNCSGDWVDSGGGSDPTSDPVPDPCPSGNCQGGGGGGTDLVPETPANLTDRLVITFCDGTETTNQFVSAVQANLLAYKTRNCVTAYIFNILNNKNYRINFCAKFSKGGANYSPNTNTITFADANLASFPFLMDHEMFHVFQDDFYGNTNDYGMNGDGTPRPGFVNLEFEQKMTTDIAEAGAAAFETGTDNQRLVYENWLTSIRNDFSRHGVPEPGSTRYNTFMTNYFYHLNQFNSIPGNSYSSTILSTLKPTALYSILQTSPNCL